jgi:hypothetical protein
MEQYPGILLSTAYFGSIRYFSKFVAYPEIIIEQHEHFIKQTYRNRAVILGANGPVPLIIPVEKGREIKIPIKDLRIAYNEQWQRNHWRTIFSAYNSSPFFEYYADDLLPFFQKKYPFLLDFNLQLTECILSLLEIQVNLKKTDGFELIPQGFLNFRDQINPKNHRNPVDPHFEPPVYTQVFQEKYGFMADLSILDLLFNEGPLASEILGLSVRK